MHILEQYALSCGVKIGRPYIREEYYPIAFDKYICLHAGSGLESKNYDYWQEVVDIIEPELLSKGIRIVQIGGPKERPIGGTVRALGTTKGQMAYKIQNSIGLMTNDTFSVHLASYYDKPIVCVSSILWPGCFYPYWSDPNKYKILDSHRDGKKPSFSAQEDPKTINFIKPEEVAEAVFDKILLSQSKPWYKTVFMGDRYRSIPIHDFVPNQIFKIPDTEQNVLQIRYDLHSDEKILANQLVRNKATVITNKPISVELLTSLASRIPLIVYIIEQNDDPSFIKKVNELGLKSLLVSALPQEELDKKKISYYEYGRINPVYPLSKEKIDEILRRPNLLYTSCKVLHSDGKHFASIPAMKLGIEFDENNRYQPVINCKEFWDEADFFHIVEKIN